MSLSHEVTVWCDNCAQWVQASATAKRLRKELRFKGWTHEGTQDFCPTCSDLQKADELVQRTNVFDERGGGD